jgi:hypothetical protein
VSLSAQAPAFRIEGEGDEISQSSGFSGGAGSGNPPSASRSGFGSANLPFANPHPISPMRGHGPMMHGLGNFQDLQVAIPLADGQWLTFVTNLPESGPAFSSQFLVSMAIMAAITLGVSIWVVRQVNAARLACGRGRAAGKEREGAAAARNRHHRNAPGFAGL